MIEMLVIIGLMTILVGGFTGYSFSDALGVAIGFTALILFGGMATLFVIALVASLL